MFYICLFTDNKECSGIYGALISFPWLRVFSNDIPRGISQIIAIYATGKVLYCQNSKCTNNTREALLMKSSKFKKCSNKDCNELLTCCSVSCETCCKSEKYCVKCIYHYFDGCEHGMCKDCFDSSEIHKCKLCKGEICVQCFQSTTDHEEPNGSIDEAIACFVCADIWCYRCANKYVFLTQCEFAHDYFRCHFFYCEECADMMTECALCQRKYCDYCNDSFSYADTGWQPCVQCEEHICHFCAENEDLKKILCAKCKE